jgi:hypothetical protein
MAFYLSADMYCILKEIAMLGGCQGRSIGPSCLASRSTIVMPVIGRIEPSRVMIRKLADYARKLQGFPLMICRKYAPPVVLSKVILMRAYGPIFSEFWQP